MASKKGTDKRSVSKQTTKKDKKANKAGVAANIDKKKAKVSGL